MALTDVELNLGSGGAKIAVDNIGGIDYEVVKQAFGADGDLQLVAADNPLPVTIENSPLSVAVDGTVVITPPQPSTASPSSVAQSATNVNLLSNADSRLGATIFNDSINNLYVLLGTTASLTQFTVKLLPQAYYEVPFSYIGNIDGIWDSAGIGAARITDLS